MFAFCSQRVKAVMCLDPENFSLVTVRFVNVIAREHY
jgi:hypothetical protein